MRILSIAVRNLASLAGTQPVVRFGEGGLASGLIAVTGPTGAGKSTVLDALCLGLYGATPRLPTGRSEDLNPRNILTRDATDGFAEVEFEGAEIHQRDTEFVGGGDGHLARVGEFLVDQVGDE